MIEGGQGWDQRQGGVNGSSEPRRLIDEPAGDPSSPAGWAVGLLRTVGPYRAPAARKQRVRLGLGQSGARRAPLVLRPAIAGAVLIGCGAVASAALGHWPALVAHAYQRLVTPAADVAPSPVPVEPRARHAGGRKMGLKMGLSGPAATPTSTTTPEVASATLAISPAPALEPGPGPATVPTSPTPSPRRASASNRESISGSRVHHAAPVVAVEETSPVLEAMRALRREGNPVRARALLARYLERHPGGTLAEEAMALSIEAAVDHHDADASTLARRYLRRYPAGHFVTLARQTIAGDADALR